MSSIAIPGSASTLPQVSVRPHGHKHGARVESTDDSSTDSSSDTAAQIPVGTAQSAFGSLFQTLEQVIGLQPPSATTSAAGATTVAGATTAAGVPTTFGGTPVSAAAAATSAAGAATTPNASNHVQSYLSNASASVQPSIRLNV